MSTNIDSPPTPEPGISPPAAEQPRMSRRGWWWVVMPVGLLFFILLTGGIVLSMRGANDQGHLASTTQPQPDSAAGARPTGAATIEIVAANPKTTATRSLTPAAQASPTLPPVGSPRTPELAIAQLATAGTTGQGTAAPRATTFSGEWLLNFGRMRLTQTGNQVTGTYENFFFGSSGSIDGVVSGAIVTGSWSAGGVSGPIQWTLNADGQALTGYFKDEAMSQETYAWCGARPNQPFPDGCGFAGSWTARIGDQAECPITLTRVNMAVTGRYCNGGTLSGTISTVGSALQTMLIGVTVSPDTPTANFTLYVMGYDANQFQGHWVGDRPESLPTQWCGWRSGAQPPDPCFR